MNEKINNAIDILAEKIVVAIQPEQALKFTQAMLNLAYVKNILADELKSAKIRGPGA